MINGGGLGVKEDPRRHLCDGGKSVSYIFFDNNYRHRVPHRERGAGITFRRIIVGEHTHRTRFEAPRKYYAMPPYVAKSETECRPLGRIVTVNYSTRAYNISAADVRISRGRLRVLPRGLFGTYARY